MLKWIKKKPEEICFYIFVLLYGSILDNLYLSSLKFQAYA